MGWSTITGSATSCQPREKGCGKCFQYIGQQVWGAAVYNAVGIRSCNVCCYGMCGPAPFAVDEIWEWKLSMREHGFDPGWGFAGESSSISRPTPQ